MVADLDLRSKPRKPSSRPLVEVFMSEYMEVVERKERGLERTSQRTLQPLSPSMSARALLYFPCTFLSPLFLYRLLPTAPLSGAQAHLCQIRSI